MLWQKVYSGVFIKVMIFAGVILTTASVWAQKGAAPKSRDIEAINPTFGFDLQRFPSYLVTPSVAERTLRTFSRSLISEYEKAFNQHFSLPETAPTFEYLWQHVAADILQRKADGKILAMAKELPSGIFERRVREQCTLYMRTLVAHASFIQRRDLDEIKKRADDTLKQSENAVAAISQRAAALDDELKSLKADVEKRSAAEEGLTINLAKLLRLSDGAFYFWGFGILASVSFVFSLLALLKTQRF